MSTVRQVSVTVYVTCDCLAGYTGVTCDTGKCYSTRVTVWRATPVSTVRQVSVTVHVSLSGGLHRCQM